MRAKNIWRAKMMKPLKIFFVFLLLLSPLVVSSQVQERFPKPDFQSDYIRPELLTPEPRAAVLEYLDVFVLAAALILATYLAHKKRSRRSIFLLMIFALAYFGFYRKGCVCSIGAIQNVSFALFNPTYVIPVSVILFFALPLVFALFYGRTFCAAVCPLGAIQDAVVLKPVKVPEWLGSLLSIVPYIYLGLAVLFAATGAGFIICRYDPFIGFFRFGADFNMVILGLSMLLLGTVVARPYCRYLCPLGVFLGWMSRLSWRHVRITPDECNNCRLCEESCPFGAIKKADEETPPDSGERDVKRLAVVIVLLPLVVFGSGWIGSRLDIVLSRLHPTVSLAEEVLLENAGKRTEMTDATKAFRATGKPSEELFAEAGSIQNKFHLGGWILGGFVGLVIGLKLIGLFIRRQRKEYEVDKGTCLSCGRCFAYCPYEQVRLGLMTREELSELGRRDGPVKQFRA
jgi:NosR/NirI family nitrous oxide reductase transcriptional regulator